MAPAPPLNMLELSRWSSSMREQSRTTGDYGLRNCSSCSTNFTFTELQAATMNFSPENLNAKEVMQRCTKGGCKTGKLWVIKCLVKGTTEEKIVDIFRGAWHDGARQPSKHDQADWVWR